MNLKNEIWSGSGVTFFSNRVKSALRGYALKLSEEVKVPVKSVKAASVWVSIPPLLTGGNKENKDLMKVRHKDNKDTILFITQP